MNLIERTEIDTNRWDKLVSNHKEASFFSYSWYLDALAENWCILVDDDYSKGIALPYTKRMGVSILYTPIFSRAVHPIGDLTKVDLETIQRQFPVIEIGTTEALFGIKSERIHQVIVDFENRKISSQAKRSLKKAKNSLVRLTYSSSYGAIVEAIQLELKDKFKGVDAARIQRLIQLFAVAEEQGFIKVFEVSDDVETGGIVCLEDDVQVLYLKGACPENLKKNGGMYLALNAGIEYAQSQGKRFDFGGSNVPGVRKFNMNLGGVDQTYYFNEVNNGPVWFNWARKLKNRG